MWAGLSRGFRTCTAGGLGARTLRRCRWVGVTASVFVVRFAVLARRRAEDREVARESERWVVRGSAPDSVICDSSTIVLHSVSTSRTACDVDHYHPY